MSDTDRFLLKQIVEQERDTNAPLSGLNEYFEVFSAEQILKELGFDLDPDQVLSGIVGGGNDGGVDSFYVFANRRLVRPDHDLKRIVDQQITIEVIIIQSKNSNSFGETTITKLLDFTDKCLKLTSDLTVIPTELYSPQIVEAVELFHNLYKAALLKRPKLNISYYYASIGDQINSKVKSRSDMLSARCKEHYSAAEVHFNFVGAAELLSYYNRAPSTTITLDTAKNIGLSSFGTAYLCLVPLRKFYDFITYNDTLRGHIFEANVRDFQGDVNVNNDITRTLTIMGNEEFWWLNNGITIIATEVIGDGELITITDPLIVNGLQTSYVIYSHFNGTKLEDQRNILVRVIKATDPQSIDNIIKATNSQTKIPAIWLHATEDIHRKIEIALKSTEFYYDRRKNHHKNQGVPAAKIVTLPYLAQAVAAIVLQVPNDARARPTTVADKHYSQMFSDKFPIDLYPKCAALLKRVDQFLDKLTDRGVKNDVIFYVAMYVSCAAVKKSKPKRNEISSIDISMISDDLIQDCLDRVREKYEKLGGDDKVAKGTQLVDELKNEIAERYANSS